MKNYSVIIEKFCGKNDVILETDDLILADQQFMRSERELGIKYRPFIHGFDDPDKVASVLVQCQIINNKNNETERKGHIYVKAV